MIPEQRTIGAFSEPLKIRNTTSISITNSSNASSIQRGFVQGRQATLNIVDLDSISRAFANQVLFPGEAILSLWDFLAAFPSLRHAWILLVFREYGFPPGFLLFLEALL